VLIVPPFIPGKPGPGKRSSLIYTILALVLTLMMMAGLYVFFTAN
jgi:hypothetical protein